NKDKIIIRRLKYLSNDEQKCGVQYKKIITYLIIKGTHIIRFFTNYLSLVEIKYKNVKVGYCNIKFYIHTLRYKLIILLSIYYTKYTPIPISNYSQIVSTRVVKTTNIGENSIFPAGKTSFVSPVALISKSMCISYGFIIMDRCTYTDIWQCCLKIDKSYYLNKIIFHMPLTLFFFFYDYAYLTIIHHEEKRNYIAPHMKYRYWSFYNFPSKCYRFQVNNKSKLLDFLKIVLYYTISI
ncbi:hypothetical protein AGLY_007289, partial [Aphis glycines]